MHATETKSATFHHNGDYDGEVVISGVDANDLERLTQVRVDFEDLLEFVAGAVRERQLADFEHRLADTADRSILGF